MTKCCLGSTRALPVVLNKLKHTIAGTIASDVELARFKTHGVLSSGGV